MQRRREDTRKRVEEDLGGKGMERKEVKGGRRDGKTKEE